MDPISNVDRLVHILHQRLAEKARAAGRPAPAPKPDSGKRGIEKLAGLSGLSERQLKRALIAHILADQLGEQLVNDPRFQQIAEKVTETLDTDPYGAKLLTAVISDLRQSA